MNSEKLYTNKSNNVVKIIVCNMLKTNVILYLIRQFFFDISFKSMVLSMVLGIQFYNWYMKFLIFILKITFFNLT